MNKFYNSVLISFHPCSVNIITNANNGTKISIKLSPPDNNFYFSASNLLKSASNEWTMNIFSRESTGERIGTIYYLTDSTSAQIDIDLTIEYFNQLLSTILTGNSPDWISIRTDGVEYLSDKKIWNVEKDQINVLDLSIRTPIVTKKQ
jgi:hypothetical protein